MEEQLRKLKSRIPYDAEVFNSQSGYEIALKELLEDSKNIGLQRLFPYEDYSEMELPKKHLNWQIRCCLELYNLADKAGISNYAENGISWSKLSDGLSTQLLSELIPKVGVPKSE